MHKLSADLASSHLSQLHRELEQLKGQRVEHQTRIGSLLCTQGESIPIRKDFIERLGQAKQYDGKALPHYLIERVKREYELLKVVHKQILSIEAERRKLLKQSKTRRVEKVRRLHQLRGVGVNGSWLWMIYGRGGTCERTSTVFEMITTLIPYYQQ